MRDGRDGCIGWAGKEGRGIGSGGLGVRSWGTFIEVQSTLMIYHYVSTPIHVAIEWIVGPFCRLAVDDPTRRATLLIAAMGICPGSESRLDGVVTD